MTTEEPDQRGPDRLTPADEARVRDLLADARASGPMPADVAVRLDETILALAAERAAVLDTSYTDLGPAVRTRRHRVVAVLGAAAAVAVVGLGVGAFFERDDSGHDATSAGTGVVRGDDALAEADEDAAAPEDGRDPSRTGGPGDSAAPESALVLDARPPVVHSGHLGRDLARLQERAVGGAGATDYTSSRTLLPDGFTCDVASQGHAILVGVRYDGAPAYVAFQEPMGDSQVVEVLQCGTHAVLRSTTLPVER